MVEEQVAGAVGPVLLHRLHAALERLWRGAPDVDDLDRDGFRLAVAEVVGNLVRHVPGDQPVHAEVRLRADTHVLEAVCVDDADTETVPTLPDDPTAALATVPADATSGRGLALATWAAEVTVTRRDGRTTWTITRGRRPR